MQIIPLYNSVLVKPYGADQKESMLTIPDTAKADAAERGTIIAVAEEIVSLKAGDEILFKKYTPDEFEIEGEKVLLIQKEDVLAKLEP